MGKGFKGYTLFWMVKDLKGFALWLDGKGSQGLYTLFEGQMVTEKARKKDIKGFWLCPMAVDNDLDAYMALLFVSGLGVC